MGNSKSNVLVVTENEKIFLHDYLLLSSSDIKKLWKAFRKIDVRGDGFVEFDEFCARIKCETIPFLQNIFCFFGDGRHTLPALRFSEFVLFTCFFLSLDEPGLANFLFFVLTDSDFNLNLRSKTTMLSLEIFEEEIHHLFGSVWGDRKHIHRAARTLDSNGSGTITMAEFVEGIHHNRSLLFPAVAFQVKICIATSHVIFTAKRSHFIVIRWICASVL